MNYTSMVMKYLRFEHLTTEYKSEQKVLITIEMNTTDRENSFKNAREHVLTSIINRSPQRLELLLTLMILQRCLVVVLPMKK